MTRLHATRWQDKRSQVKRSRDAIAGGVIAGDAIAGGVIGGSERGESSTGGQAMADSTPEGVPSRQASPSPPLNEPPHLPGGAARDKNKHHGG